MKQITSLLIAIILGLAASAQTIHIADNNVNRPTGANIYSTIQAAVTAALPGDIVYVTPSDVKYNETVTIGKKIKLVGAGFNSDLGTRRSSLTTLNLVTSLDGTNPIANSEFTGLIIDYIDFTTGSDVGSFSFNNLIFENCNWYQMKSSGNHRAINDLIIRNNFFAEVNLNSSSGNTNIRIYKNIIQPDNYRLLIRLSNCTNPLISNNLFFPFPPGGYDNRPIGIANSTNVRIEHNIFSKTNNGQPTFEYLQNAMVVNNIFYGLTPGCVSTTNTFRDNVFSNNLVLTTGAVVPPPSNPTGSDFHSGINNIIGVSPLFTNAPNSTYLETYNYSLQPGSPCVGAATTGENIGPSGGLYPWTGNLTLKATAVPVITLFGNSGVVPQNQPLKSNIKAKAN